MILTLLSILTSKINILLFNIILLISRLPINSIYVISDFLIFLVFKVFKYRTKVIKENISNSFPEKSEEEIKKIIKQFYQNFSSFIAELIKLFTISRKEHSSKLKLNNLHLFTERSNKKNNSIVLLGHVMNWEFISVFKSFIEDKNIFAVYMEIQNKFWNKKMYKLRAKYGLNLVKMQNTIELMRSTPNDGSSLFAVIGDQSPHISKANFSFDFLGRETPIFVGYDFLAVEKNFDVFYLEIERKNRGFYEMNLFKIEPENGVKFDQLEISEKYFRLLEETIRKDPSNYLWTHKRWKHKKGEDY